MNKCLNCEKEVKAKYCNVTCQNIHQGAERANKSYGEYKLFNVECGQCKNSFQVKEREKLFPQKEAYYCSRACANTRVHSDETKTKIASSLKIYPVKIKHNCPYCDKPTTNKKFCSRSCAAISLNLGGRGRKAGLSSVSVQSKNRRSKNEIYFGELCEQKYNLVKFNEPMFNGWDADIIIEDLRLAILWNGKWHYEKITEKHSVEQVQNRDKIKLKEIENAGYKSYVIKDMGKYKKLFVEEKFQEMLVYLKL